MKFWSIVSNMRFLLLLKYIKIKKTPLLSQAKVNSFKFMLFVMLTIDKIFF